MLWKWLAVAVAGVAVAGSVSCSGGSTLPKPGSPGYYWSSAKSAYKAGDFVKTDEELQRIMVGENEFTARARAWDMVLTGGMAQGYAALADVYEKGAKADRQNPLPYRKRVSELRALSGSMAMELADDVHKFLEQPKQDKVTLAFAFPAGSVAEPAGLEKLGRALFVQDSEQAQMRIAMLQRGVLLALCGATGNPGDTAKTQALFDAAEVQVPRDIFVLAAAKLLQESSDVFTDKKLDLPNKLKVVSVEALSALKSVPAGKETKAITDKIQKALKKANLTDAL